MTNTSKLVLIPGGELKALATAKASLVALEEPVIGNIIAGVPFPLTQTILKPDGSIDTEYRGTVHFSTDDKTKDPAYPVMVPNPYQYSAADSGQHVFSFTLRTVSGTGHTRNIFVGGDNLQPSKGSVNIWFDALATREGFAPRTAKDVSVTPHATFIDITFAPAVPDNRYDVNVKPSWSTGWAITNKTVNDFRITFTAAAPSGATITWKLFYTTACGHVITDLDHFVALPAHGLCNVMVYLAHEDAAAQTRVLDVGPWFGSGKRGDDPYWNIRGRPRAEIDNVGNRAGIDLADGTFWDPPPQGLGLKDNARIYWRFA